PKSFKQRAKIAEEKRQHASWTLERILLMRVPSQSRQIHLPRGRIRRVFLRQSARGKVPLNLRLPLRRLRVEHAGKATVEATIYLEVRYVPELPSYSRRSSSASQFRATPLGQTLARGSPMLE